MAFSHVAIIYNPNSGRPRGRRSAVDRCARLLQEAGIRTDVYRTSAPGEATDLARHASVQGCDLIMVHGGDGTMNEVLQALVGTDVTLGFWPGGTANVLAVEIGFPKSVVKVVRRIMAGRIERVTVGKANDRYFMLMAGIGFDAKVAAGVDPVLKKKLGKGAFALSALRCMVHWGLAPVRVQLPGEEFEARFVVAGNARSYGGGFSLTPQAGLMDPHLDLCIYSSHRRLDYFRLAFWATMGRHLHMRGLTYRKVRTVNITAPHGGPVLVQLDGEVADQVPLTLEAVPAAVNLLV